MPNGNVKTELNKVKRLMEKESNNDDNYEDRKDIMIRINSDIINLNNLYSRNISTCNSSTTSDSEQRSKPKK